MINNHPKCNALKERAESVLAGGPATLSKHWSRYPQGLGPGFIDHGDGAYVWCPDGLKYIDCVSALGPIILGHSNPLVTLEVMKQAEKLASSTMSTSLEVEVSEMLCGIIPGAEQVRYSVSGKDVTEAAVKLARYTTNKKHMIYVGYHGGFGDYLSTTDKSGGLLPELADWNHQVPWRNIDALEAVMDHANGDIAGIILEVPPEYPGVTIEETATILLGYRGMAHANGGLFVLDEIVTGLRYGAAGAQGMYQIQADLVTMSKALGNGYPVAAIMGQRALMQGFDQGKVFLSTTFGANPIGLAAAKATLGELASLSHGWGQLKEQGEALYTQMRALLSRYHAPAVLKGNFARMVIEWDDIPEVATKDELRTLWMQETAKRGVLFGVPIFPMTCYDAVTIQKILYAVDGACQAIKKVQWGTPVAEILEVPVSGSVFERYAGGIRGQ